MGEANDKYSVLKETDARKLGVQLVKPVKLRDLKGPDLVELYNKELKDSTKVVKEEASKIIDKQKTKPAESKISK